MYYTTLSQVKSDLKLTSDESDDDALLLRWIRLSSKFIEIYKRRRYDIRRETINFDTPFTGAGQNAYYNSVYGSNYGDLISNILHIYEDLVSVEELTNGDGEIILPADYILLDRHLYPKFAIKLKPFSNVSFELDDNGNSEEAIGVDGFWGYVNPETCWVLSNDTVLNTPLSAVDVTLTVTDASGAASDLLSPRFEVGMMLRIEDEFLYITGISGNNLTVSRGYNGTAAAEHVATTEIYVFRPDDTIVQMTTRLVAWRYRQKDVDSFDKVFNFGDKTMSIPSALPVDVQEMLGGRKVRML